MILFWLGVAIALFAGVATIKAMWYGDDAFGNGLACFVGLMVFVLITGLVGVAPPALIGTLAPGSCVNPQNTQLVNLSDGGSVSGSFFLGSGYLNGNLEYYYYTRNADGGYQGGAIDARDAVVYQDNPTTPYIASYTEELNGVWFYLGFPSGTCQETIHIPQGSIKEGYSLGH